MKHLAPRPWSIDTGQVGRKWTNSLTIVDGDSPPGDVAYLTRGYEGDAQGDDCPSWANARLIAAAPDLLDAILKSDDAHWTPAMRVAVRKATEPTK